MLVSTKYDMLIFRMKDTPSQVEYRTLYLCQSSRPLPAITAFPLWDGVVDIKNAGGQPMVIAAQASRTQREEHDKELDKVIHFSAAIPADAARSHREK